MYQAIPIDSVAARPVNSILVKRTSQLLEIAFPDLDWLHNCGSVLLVDRGNEHPEWALITGRIAAKQTVAWQALLRLVGARNSRTGKQRVHWCAPVF
ncbi:hypothetical protein K239x_35600 [Planctomycetes bacterium K23_9]|uniref:Uncharacterized protein n=1 Tax=Stieleria marina TaxID=1930275 RepID=A0A517NWR8_9BACT|nr:hypothetical protein K239x_35600 [Planctomycetes bacterium K23_9]